MNGKQKKKWKAERQAPEKKKNYGMTNDEVKIEAEMKRSILEH